MYIVSICIKDPWVGVWSRFAGWMRSLFRMHSDWEALVEQEAKHLRYWLIVGTLSWKLKVYGRVSSWNWFCKADKNVQIKNDLFFPRVFQKTHFNGVLMFWVRFSRWHVRICLNARLNSREKRLYMSGFSSEFRWPAHVMIEKTTSWFLTHFVHNAIKGETRKNGNQQQMKAPTTIDNVLAARCSCTKN